MLQPPQLSRQTTNNIETSFVNPKTGRKTLYGSRTHRELVRDGYMAYSLDKSSLNPVTPQKVEVNRQIKPVLEKTTDLLPEDEDEGECSDDYTEEELAALDKYFQEK